MSFADVVRRTWRENHLFSALIELTYRCNWDCFFCYNDLALRGKPLEREHYFRLFADLRDLGALNLILSGGEPLAHPDFFVLGAKGRELGFLIRVKSNGHALRGAVARRLREEIDPWIVEVSLHGATAATHDRQTRVPGSFQRLLENLRELQGLGVRLQMNATLTAWNEDELEEMVELGRSLGIPLQVDPEVSARDDGDAEPLSIRASRQGVLRLFRLQAEARRAALGAGAATADLAVGREGDALLPDVPGGEKHCGAGAATIAVDPYGTVYPCVQWRRPVGNLHERSLAEIWTASAELDAVRQDNEQVRAMLQELGPTAGLMGFCPGNAAAATGSPLRLYPAAASKLALRREVAAEAARSVLPILR